VPLTLPRAMIDAIVAHARAEAPNECCGIIGGTDGEAKKLIKATNAEHSPYRYNIDSRELLRIYRELDEQGWEIVVIYHSHTHTPAYPSPTDLSLAGYPDAFYVIVSLAQEPPDVRAYRIRDGAVTEESLVGA
jgi:proteasome lid subunit RPN8/RPN11